MSITPEMPSLRHEVPTGWVRVVVASASASAGVIHLAMVPSHAGESTLEGVGFAGFGWAQILVAALVMLRPVGAAPWLGAVNLAAMAMWVWSRTSGLPFGAHGGEAGSVGVVDAAAAGFGALGALGGFLLFVNPGIGARLGALGHGLGGAALSGGLLLTSVALASPSARDHGSSHAVTGAVLAGSPVAMLGDHPHPDGVVAAPEAAGGSVTPASTTEVTGDDAHGHASALAGPVVTPEDRCDLELNPSAYWEETTFAGIDTTNGSHGLASGHDHSAALATIQGSPELDRLIALTTSAEGAESKDARVVAALGEVDDQTYRDWLRWLPSYTAAHATGVSVDDNGGHGGHLGPQPWIAMTDQEECDQLKSELDQARSVALQYPTAADALAAGWMRVTGYVPGIAAHYMNFRYVDGTFDIARPEMLLYDGDGPEANMVGLSYYLLHQSEYEPTQGFTGPNDHFHRHIGLCVGVGGVIGDSSTSEEECSALGGRKQNASGGWMNHVWIVPGCESPWGLFSGASPLLENGLARASGGDDGGCQGSPVRSRYELTPGSLEQVVSLWTAP
jgi:hypothetical protein